MAKMKNFRAVIFSKMAQNKVVASHALAWLIYFALTNLNFYVGSGGKTMVFSIFLHLFLVGAIIFYGNVYFVASYFLPRKQYFGQLLGILFLFAIYAFCRYILDFIFLPHFGKEYAIYASLDRFFIYDTAWFTIQYLLLSFGYWFSLYSLKVEKEKKLMIQQLLEYERKGNQFEMDFLRRQISPHFIYNVLSSLYTKLNKQVPEMAEPILLLSEIMAYTTKASKSNEEVLLEDELENIQHFLALEKFRYGENFFVNYKVSGYPDRDDKILPLVLLTFIENAFKYGHRSNPDHPISITIDIDDNTLTFFCKNLIQRITPSKKSNKIGLSNTIRRLELKYEGRYSLAINEVENEYIVNFRLMLN
jgi:two-component system, LytTR family, sensor kinase